MPRTRLTPEEKTDRARARALAKRRERAVLRRLRTEGSAVCFSADELDTVAIYLTRERGGYANTIWVTPEMLRALDDAIATIRQMGEQQRHGSHDGAIAPSKALSDRLGECIRRLEQAPPNLSAVPH